MRAKDKPSVQTAISHWLARKVGKPVPYRLLVITALSVVAADVVVQVVRQWIPPTPPLLHLVIDAIITILFVMPVLFYTLFKPLVEQIRHRRAAEHRLMESQKHYQAIVEDQTELICRFQGDGTITFANQAYTNAACFSNSAAHGSSFFENVPPEGREELLQAITALTVQNPVLTVEYSLQGCGEDLRRILWTIRIITSPSGKEIGWQAVGRDITEQNRILQELNQSRQELEDRVEERTSQLQQINLSLREEILIRERAEHNLHVQSAALEAAANGIIITDRDGCIQWSNPAFSRMTGYNAEEVLNQNPHFLNSGFHDNGFFEDLWNTILAGQVWSGEIINRRKDGSIYVEEQTITPILNKWGEVTQFICIKNDVTRRKQAENDIRRRNWELSALNMISSKVSRSLEPAEIFSAMRNLLVNELSVTIGAVFTRSSASQPFQIATAWGWPEPVIEQMGLNLLCGESALQHLSTKQPFLIRNGNQVTEAADSPAYENSEAAWTDELSWHFCHCIPLLAQDEVIGMLQLYSDSPDGFTAEDSRLFESLTAPIGVAIQNARLFEEIQDGRARLQALSHRLVEIQENERRHIARELHDEVSQALTYLIYALDILRKDAHSADNVEEDIAELDKIVQNVLENLHRLAVDLRPASLDLLGLIPAIRQYAEITQEKHGIDVLFFPTGENKRLPGDMETSVYRIIQEAVSNAVRHAQATRIEITLNQWEDLLKLQVTDNGVGFDPRKADLGGRLGIVGMRERVEMLGGQMIIDSAEGKGTIIVVEVPNAHSRTDR